MAGVQEIATVLADGEWHPLADLYSVGSIAPRTVDNLVRWLSRNKRIERRGHPFRSCSVRALPGVSLLDGRVRS